MKNILSISKIDSNDSNIIITKQIVDEPIKFRDEIKLLIFQYHKNVSDENILQQLLISLSDFVYEAGCHCDGRIDPQVIQLFMKFDGIVNDLPNTLK